MEKIILTTLAPVSHRTSEENLGILYLASSLRKYNYEVEIIDGWLENLTVDEVFERIIKNNNILYVGISSYMTNTQASVELMSKLKKNNATIKIISGGFGPTFYPKEYLEAGSDIVSIGEGEETLVEIAEYFQGKRNISSIHGIAYLNENEMIVTKPRKLLENLDLLPNPARDTMPLALKNKSTINVVSSRGCSGNCDFCSVIAFFRLSEGKVWRTRSINNIVDELEYLYNQGVQYIKFVDDSFIDGDRDENWCKEFADMIENRNLKLHLRGQIRADKVNEKILKDLKRAGFFSFACGIENGSQLALTRMNKKASVKDNQLALDLFKKYNYIVQMGFILFDQYTTIDELKENLEFLAKNNHVVTKGVFSEMFSAEGSKLNSKLRENNQLKESTFIKNNNKYEFINTEIIPIYNGLKFWHKSHSIIYDMIIDPVTAPKALPFDDLREFYKLSLELKEKDLEFFRNVLDAYSRNSLNNGFVENCIEQSNEFYINKYEQAKILYKKNELKYNANRNPFI